MTFGPKLRSTFTIVRRPGIVPAAGTCVSYDAVNSTQNNRSSFFNSLPAYAQNRERSRPSSERYNGVGIYGFADGHARAVRPERVNGQCGFGFTPNGTEFAQGSPLQGNPDFRF